MKKFIPTWVRNLAATVATVYFFTNVALAYTPEKNLWTERRRHAEQNRAGTQDNLLLASLPAASSPSALFHSLPSTSRVASALSKELAKTLPLSVTSAHEKLFNSLQTTHGTIRKVWLPAQNAGDRVVVHIQDVHQNQDAQRHIAGALESLLQSGQAGVVGLEGAFAPIDVKAYHDYENREVIRLTADYLLKENLITGPVHAAMTTPAPLAPMVGVDDPVHYNANVEAYRQSAPKIDEYKKVWEAKKYKLAEEKKNLFSPTLFAFDAKVEKYHSRGEGLAEYVEALAPVKGQGHAGLLAQAFDMEKVLDFNRVEADRKSLIDKLVKVLTQDQINQLVQESTSYRVGQVRYAAFYTYLKDLCRGAKVDLAKYPHMDAYIRYVLLSDRIDAEKLMTELTDLEKYRYTAFVKTEEEKGLVCRSRAVTLAGRLLTFELTPEEWAEYVKINAGESLGLDMAGFEAFYKEAHARDEFLTANLLKAMEDGHHKTAVLVTGGYHTDGVSERLNQAGVTVVTFTPRVETIDTKSGSTYLSIFTQEKTPLEKLFAGEKLFTGQNPWAGSTSDLTAPAVAAGSSAVIESLSTASLLLSQLAGKFKKKSVDFENGVASVTVWGSEVAHAVRVIVEKGNEGVIVRQTLVNVLSFAAVIYTLSAVVLPLFASFTIAANSLLIVFPGADFIPNLTSSLLAIVAHQPQSAFSLVPAISPTFSPYAMEGIRNLLGIVLVLYFVRARTGQTGQKKQNGGLLNDIKSALSIAIAAIFLFVSEPAPAAPVSQTRVTEVNEIEIVKRNIHIHPSDKKNIGFGSPSSSYTIPLQPNLDSRPVPVQNADNIRINYSVSSQSNFPHVESKGPFLLKVGATVSFYRKNGSVFRSSAAPVSISLRSSGVTANGVVNVSIPSGAKSVKDIVISVRLANGGIDTGLSFKDVSVDLTRKVEPPTLLPVEIQNPDQTIIAPQPQNGNADEPEVDDSKRGAAESQPQVFRESIAGRVLKVLSPVLLLLALMVVSPDALAEIMNHELFYEGYKSLIWGTSLVGIAVIIFGYRYNRGLKLTPPVILFLGFLAVPGLNFIFQGKNLYDASKDTPVSANTANQSKKIEKDQTELPNQDSRGLEDRERPSARPIRPERGNLSAVEQRRPWEKLSAFVALTAGVSLPSWAGEGMGAIASVSDTTALISWMDFVLPGLGFVAGIVIFAFRHKNKHKIVEKFKKLAVILTVIIAQTANAFIPPVPDYNFARQYSNQSLVNPDQQRNFVEKVIATGARFLKPGISYNEKSGLTYDGHGVNPKTGERLGPARNWSAASKESIQVTLWALAVDGNAGAKKLISPENVGSAEKKALELLEKKISTYEKFNRTYSGFGGFLPWFKVSDDGMSPTNDWQNRVPGLDNGQLAWSLFLAADILQQKGQTALAARYKAYYSTMAKNAPMMFLDVDTGQIRAEVRIKNTKAAPTLANYSNNVSGYFLNDPYEGEAFALFMTLFSPGLDPTTKDRIWKNKSLVMVQYKTKDGQTIPVRQGHWYSAHEMWPFLVLPYTDSRVVSVVFKNGEKVRTIYSAENKIPGLFASVSAPEGDQGYLSETGIPSVAKQAVKWAHVVAPYAVSPVMVADFTVGLSWLRAMLAAPRAVGPLGVSEAVTVDGKRITPIVTWDGHLFLVPLLGEAPLARMRDAMKRAGVYEGFLARIEKKYESVFPNTRETTVGYSYPTGSIPENSANFSSVTQGGNLLSGIDRWDGGGDLMAGYSWRQSVLRLAPVNGFVWAKVSPINIGENPIVHLRVRTRGKAEVYLEFKNTQDILMTPNKIAVEFPDTNGQFQTFTINLTGLISTTNKETGILALSDPSGGPIEFEALQPLKVSASGTTTLTKENGGRFVSGVKSVLSPQTGASSTVTLNSLAKQGVPSVSARGQALEFRAGGKWGDPRDMDQLNLDKTNDGVRVGYKLSGEYVGAKLIFDAPQSGAIQVKITGLPAGATIELKPNDLNQQNYGNGTHTLNLNKISFLTLAVTKDKTGASANFTITLSRPDKRSEFGVPADFSSFLQSWLGKNALTATGLFLASTMAFSAGGPVAYSAWSAIFLVLVSISLFSSRFWESVLLGINNIFALMLVEGAGGERKRGRSDNNAQADARNFIESIKTPANLLSAVIPIPTRVTGFDGGQRDAVLVNQSPNFAQNMSFWGYQSKDSAYLKAFNEAITEELARNPQLQGNLKVMTILNTLLGGVTTGKPIAADISQLTILEATVNNRGELDGIVKMAQTIQAANVVIQEQGGPGIRVALSPTKDVDSKRIREALSEGNVDLSLVDVKGDPRGENGTYTLDEYVTASEQTMKNFNADPNTVNLQYINSPNINGLNQEVLGQMQNGTDGLRKLLAKSLLAWLTAGDRLYTIGVFNEMLQAALLASKSA